MRRLGLLVLVTACGRGPTCPSGLTSDAARSARVVELLRSTPSGRALPKAEHVCFAAPGGVWREDGVFVLSVEAGDRENAARLGHLLLHASEGGVQPSGRDCAQFVERALQSESRARALELTIARELSVVPLPSDRGALERDYRARCEGAAHAR